jgi:hypothetical protein
LRSWRNKLIERKSIKSPVHAGLFYFAAPNFSAGEFLCSLCFYGHNDGRPTWQFECGYEGSRRQILIETIESTIAIAPR